MFRNNRDLVSQYSESAKPEESEDSVPWTKSDQEPGGDRGSGGHPGAALDLLQQDQQPAASRSAGKVAHPLHGAQSSQVRLFNFRQLRTPEPGIGNNLSS